MLNWLNDIWHFLLSYRMRVPVSYLQTQGTECGLAAMAMILGYHGRFVTMERLRRISGVSRDCVNAADLVRIATHYHLDAKVVSREPEELVELGLPLIVYTDFIHFSVVEHVTEREVWLNDPACGRHRIPRERFHESFTGIAIQCKPSADFQPGGERPNVVSGIRRFLRGHPKWLVTAWLTGLFKTAPLVMFAYLFGQLVMQLGTPGTEWLLWLGMLLAIALHIGLQALQRHAFSRLEDALHEDRLSGLASHLLALPSAFFVYRIPAVLHKRIYDNERLAELLCRWLLPAVFNLPGLLWPVLALFLVAFHAGLMITALLLLYLLILVILFHGGAGHFRYRGEQGDAFWLELSQGLENFESFKTSGGDREFFNDRMSDYARSIWLRQTYGWFHSLSSLAPDVFGLWMLLALLGGIGGLSMATDPGLGQFMTLVILVAALYEPMRDAAKVHGKWTLLWQSLLPIEDLLEQPVTVEHAPSPARQDPRQHQKPLVSVENVSFGFTRVKPALLHQVSFTIEAGQQLGIAGPSGGGKSTLAEILVGLHRPWQGEVLFNGVAVHDAAIGRIGWVNKHPVFFVGTIRDNLCLWQTYSAEAIERAIRDACLEETIAHCNLGLDTPLLPNAANLSGGQRQRLEIARALLAEPQLLVLDEATDGLDHGLETRLRTNLRRRGITLVIVSHRQSTLQACDQVLHLVKGRIANPTAPVNQTTCNLPDFSADEARVTPPRLSHHHHAALIEVFRQVARVGGESNLALPLALLTAEGAEVKERAIERLARHHRLQARAVRFLVPTWWRRDHGPLIGFRRDNQRPVAILPAATGGYIMQDPVTNQQQPITPDTAQTLDQYAFKLYRRFSGTGQGVYRYFLHDSVRLRPDLASAGWASIALLLVALGIPLIAYQLFSEASGQWHSGLLLLGSGLLLLELIRLHALHRMEGRLELSAASALFQQVIRLQPLFLRDFSPRLVARSLHCVPRVLDALRNRTLRHLISGLGAVPGLAVIAWFSPWLAVVALLVMVPLIAAPPLLMRHRHPWLAPRLQQRLDNLQFLSSIFKGAAHLRHAGRAQYALLRWQQNYASERELAKHIRRSEVWAELLVEQYPWLALMLFVGAAVSLAPLPGVDPHAGWAAILLAFVGALYALRNAGGALCELYRTLPELEQLTPLTTAPLEADGPAAPLQPTPSSGAVELRQLSFTYPGSTSPALKSVSLGIAPGQFVALAGPSGSGKSTLLRLLLGFYPPDSGTIFRDGQPEARTSLTTWREQIGAVLQDDQLEVAMTIRGHIMGSRFFTLAEVREAVRLAMLEADVSAMPMGIQSIVDSDKISTGQKQRLLIARRLIRRPHLLILDEATNALPEAIQAELLTNLRSLGLSCLLVSHRASTIAAADYVYFLDAGAIRWHGTPAAFAQTEFAPVIRDEEDESNL